MPGNLVGHVIGQVRQSAADRRLFQNQLAAIAAKGRARRWVKPD